MTILRNTFWRRATMLAVAMIALAACERAADTTDPLSAVARSDNGKPGDVGNAAGGPSIGVRLLVNKAGVAVLEVSTAPFARGGVSANSMAVTLGERAGFGATGGIVELTGQSTNLNNFAVPALTAAVGDVHNRAVG